MASIITSDLVPLAERGLYQGLLVLTWAFAAAIGPVIVRPPSRFTLVLLIVDRASREGRSPKRRLGDGFSVSFRRNLGAFGSSWVRTDLNLPLAGIAFFLVMVFLRVRTPGGSLREKITRIDFVYVFHAPHQRMTC